MGTVLSSCSTVLPPIERPHYAQESASFQITRPWARKPSTVSFRSASIPKNAPRISCGPLPDPSPALFGGSKPIRTSHRAPTPVIERAGLPAHILPERAHHR